MRVGIDYRILAVGPNLISRGMPRYTQQQVRETVRRAPDWEFVLLCSPGAQTALIDPALRDAPNVVVREHVDGVPATEGIAQAPADMLADAERYQQWILDQDIDVFHATAPFLLQPPSLVGFDVCPVVANFYDLIPLIYRERYLEGWPGTEEYFRSLAFVARADRLVAISRAARADAEAHLGFPPDRVEVGWPIAERCFRPMGDAEREAALAGLHRRIRLPPHFLLAVTHVHHSKNIEGLLQGYALLPGPLRTVLPLVVCCYLDEHGVAFVGNLLRQLGIEDDVIVTGLVSNEELAGLYNQATALVHPSRYEGFGLPVLEAMRCGRAVIASSSSAIPEVAGDAGVLVDTDDPAALASAIEKLAADPDLRAELGRRGLERSSSFDAEQLAQATIASLRAAHEPPDGGNGPSRPRVAMWTPLPPVPSGIADYSADLLSELSATWDVEVFVDDGYLPDVELLSRHQIHHHSAFGRRQRQRPFDACIYQLGASVHHWYLHDPMQAHPGVAVLHDLMWSPVLYNNAYERGDFTAFRRELAEQEGEDALAELDEIQGLGPLEVGEALFSRFFPKYPMLGRIVECSPAQIVHFPAAADELRGRYPAASAQVVPMGVIDPWRRSPVLERLAGRLDLGTPPGAFVVGVFGIVHPVKQLEVCLQAFAALVERHPTARLEVVGAALDPGYARSLADLAATLGVGDAVRFVGRVADEDFRRHLVACDVVVNLRRSSTRHMSATLLRALAAGKPVVVNDLDDWGFLPGDCCPRVGRVPDDAVVAGVAARLLAFATEPPVLQAASAAARAYFLEHATVARMAAGYQAVLDGLLQDEAQPVAAS